MATPPAIRKHGVVGVVTQEDRFLVIRRSRTVVAPLAYCFPGGGIEPGESEEVAIVREMQEELGVDVQLGTRLWESLSPTRLHLAWWECHIEDFSKLCPAPAEVESIHWWNAEQMLQADGLLDSNRLFLQAMHAGEFTLDTSPKA